MKKRRIVLASILKPVDDTRMFEKIGASLCHQKDYEVFVIGYPTKESLKNDSAITQLSLKPFKRLSIARLLAPWKVFRMIYKVKPELLIVNTHDLLIVSILNRIFFGTKIIYDIQENYGRNVLHTTAFPYLVRPLLAGWIRLKERLTAPFFQAFFLAEKTYEQELPFLRNRQVVLENKTLLPHNFKRMPEPGKVTLLFSGTLADSTGIFEAIQLSKKLHLANSSIELHIIGFCAQSTTFIRIKKAIADCPFITLTGGDQMVPHQQIVGAIAKADFGVIAYPPSPHIADRMPTKLFEYLACQLPVLLQNYEPWVDFCAPYPAAIEVNFQKIDPVRLLNEMTSKSFYTIPPQDVTWASEEPKLLKKVQEILL